MKGHPIQIKSETTVNMPIEQLWSILIDDYADVGDWATSIPYSTPNPDLADGQLGRVCGVPGMGTIKETVIHLDEAAYEFTYKADGLPFFIRYIQNAWTLVPNGNQTCVLANATGELMPIIGRIFWPMMQFQMRRISREFFEDLKHYAETGVVHPRKARQLERAARKRVALS